MSAFGSRAVLAETDKVKLLDLVQQASVQSRQDVIVERYCYRVSDG